jgi:ABC-2 type transport system ATP-binding protein
LILHRGTIVAEDTPENLQAQLAGAERLYVRAGVESSELVAALLRIPGVKDVRRGEADGEAVVACAPGKDLRPLVARQIVDSGWDLFELRPTGVSLEEVFLQLTREEAAPQEDPGDA